jgi:RNA polymerase sigma-70 factor, ECF subfamily
MPTTDPNTDELLTSAATGDLDARGQLLDRFRDRLRRMVALRIDPRLAARLDPSDVVQDALATAATKFDDYLARRPLPFYLWVRRITWEQLVKTHQRHTAGKRSVGREQPPPLTDASVQLLADRLATSASSPSRRAMRSELQAQVRAALADLSPGDREVLALRHLEQLSTAEVACVLECTESAVKVRLLRALQRLRDRLDLNAGETP